MHLPMRQWYASEGLEGEFGRFPSFWHQLKRWEYLVPVRKKWMRATGQQATPAPTPEPLPAPAPAPAPTEAAGGGEAAGDAGQAGGAAAAAAAVEGGQLRALYDFTGSGEDELSFEEGDLLVLVTKEEEDWWVGEIVDRKTGQKILGFFPADYVEAA